MCNKSRKDQQKNIKLSFVLTDVSVIRLYCLVHTVTGRHWLWSQQRTLQNAWRLSITALLALTQSLCIFCTQFSFKANKTSIETVYSRHRKTIDRLPTVRRRKTQTEVFAQTQNNGPAVCSLCPYKRLHLSTHLSAYWKLLASSETSRAWY